MARVAVCYISVFFFQAEDGIRDVAVTGVQTCALPIFVTSATLTDGSGTAESWAGAEARTGARHLPKPAFRVRVPSPFDYATQTRVIIRSEERRVGKECRSRWSPYH